LNLHLIDLPIKDVNIYDDRMAMTLEDKCFFQHYLNPDKFGTIIDFGCADGSVIKYLAVKYPYKTFIGYDISIQQLNKAKENLKDFTNVMLTNDFSVCYEYSKVGLLLLNSVIHEIYAYCNEAEIKLFWGRVNQFKYVSVRDMIYDSTMNGFIPEDQYDLFIDNIPNKYKYQLNDFVSYWCNWNKLVTKKDLVHFLLKVHYKENWERELKENYFPIINTKLERCFSHHDVLHYEYFLLPYLSTYAREEFNIKITDYTHCKLLYCNQHI
jgi:hypothetical protein